MTSFSEGQLGVKILEPDAYLVDKVLDKQDSRKFSGEVLVAVEDARRFASGVFNLLFGTKSCLARMGLFFDVQRLGKTGIPDIDIERDAIRARIRAFRFSNCPVDVDVMDASRVTPEMDQDLLENKVGKVGRFYNMLVGSKLDKPAVQRLFCASEDAGRAIYEDTDAIASDGSIALRPRPLRYLVDPDEGIRPPYLPQSRTDVAGPIQKPVEWDPAHVIPPQELFITDTEKLYIPSGYAGILSINDRGNIMQPTHLNSPIVDPEFYGNLVLELFQYQPFAVSLEEVLVRLYLYRAKVVSALAPDPEQSELF